MISNGLCTINRRTRRMILAIVTRASACRVCTPISSTILTRSSSILVSTVFVSRKPTSPVAAPAAAFAELIARDLVKWQRVVKEAGLTAE